MAFMKENLKEIVRQIYPDMKNQVLIDPLFVHKRKIIATTKDDGTTENPELATTEVQTSRSTKKYRGKICINLAIFLCALI